ncbi:hypothetical protein EV128_12627 [Rhizobium azibense]|nr:hypothetical protein EV128_12627 [Rhizobium azibense]
MPDAVEAARQDTELAAAVAEGDAARVEANEATVRDRDRAPVARQIGEHSFGPAKGGLA